jgi:predicted DNA-binding transcriptional regulator YafY
LDWSEEQMNRMDRLTAMVLMLQDRSRTAGEMAGHFEVSRRTILRDVQALCEIGVPVISREGVGGGYSLPAEYRVRSLPLNTNETILLLFALGALQKLGASPFAAERVSLVAKLRAMVPHQALPEADAAMEHLGLIMPHRQKAPFLDQLVEHTRNSDWISAAYRSARGTSNCLLQPRRLWCHGGLWYCRALSHDHGTERTYRVDRFERVLRTDPPTQPTPVPCLPYDDPSHPEVCIRLSTLAVAEAELEPDLGYAVVRLEDGTGHWRFRCPPSEHAWLSRYLLRMGSEITIESPADLRERVRVLAQKMAEHHVER